MRHLFIAGLLAATVATPTFAANLITNGDFSNGTAGWTTTNPVHYTDSTGFREGAVGTTDFLSQTFSDTAHSLLTVDFDFGSDAGFQYVQFDGTTIAGSLVSGASTYQHYTFTLGHATGTDTITFAGRNDPSYNTLTHIVVTGTTVPEPASWALMVAGFGLVGAAARRRSTVVAA